MQVRRERVQIETERHRIVGVLQLPTEGYRSRTTDYLNAQETGFIALTDAEITSLESGDTQTRDFVAVGTRHIVALWELGTLGIVEDTGDAAPGAHGVGAASVPPPGTA